MNFYKKALLKGLWLGISLVILQKICCVYYAGVDLFQQSIFDWPFLFFGLTVFAFLIKNDVRDFFITGFTGLFSLLGIEFLLGLLGFGEMMEGDGLLIYFEGFLGSMLAAFVSFVLIVSGVPFTKPGKKREGRRQEIPLEMGKKMLLLAYGLFSAVTFAYLALPEQAGIGVPLFVLFQVIFLWFLVPDRKRLWRILPIVLISLNFFISANPMWHISNLAVCVVLYGAVYADGGRGFLPSLCKQVAVPVRYCSLPFWWGLESTREKAPTVKRILLAVGITVPLLILLLLFLSSADMIFREGLERLWRSFWEWISFNVLWKVLVSLLVGCYLIGALYYAHRDGNHQRALFPSQRQGDLIILTILLGTVLAVYTVFCVIQFKYLFAGSVLPYGLTYPEYARRGFFELFFLTGVNIAFILITVSLTMKKTGAGKLVTKLLCSYLCLITLVLLASSFYRMYLYCADDGLTRLRFLVFGFLIFEAVGLCITFFYIFRPKFSMIGVYAAIGLIYYVGLNLVPVDYFVAKSQVDMYLEGKRDEVEYVMTLSQDAAPQIERLLDSPAKKQAEDYFKSCKEEEDRIPKRWQRYNLSKAACEKQYDRYLSEHGQPSGEPALTTED